MEREKVDSERNGRCKRGGKMIKQPSWFLRSYIIEERNVCGHFTGVFWLQYTRPPHGVLSDETVVVHLFIIDSWSLR